MIDLHSHTSESDGTLAPADLLRLAQSIGLRALAITDHDTFAGYDQAAQVMDPGLELVCGIELSTRFQGRSIHLLGYFLKAGPNESLRKWTTGLEVGRHLRNQQLIAGLLSAGVEITLEEVTRRAKKRPGRPHFASLLVEKKYAASLQDAFDRYLGEHGSCYVPKDEPSFQEAVGQIRAAGGISSLAHPSRISRDAHVIEQYVREMCKLGLQAIEVQHSDHSPVEISLYTTLAKAFSLAVTGGSDFHGDNKPGIALGTGRHGNIRIDSSVLEQLRLIKQ
jgi:predicted metal-dependent phosphoesterase TrpH